MTHFKISDEAVEAACAKFWPTWNKSYLRTDEDRQRMREVIEAALPVMFEVVGYIEPEEIQSLAYAADEGFESDAIICSEQNEVESEPLYRLKEPK